MRTDPSHRSADAMIMGGVVALILVVGHIYIAKNLYKLWIRGETAADNPQVSYISEIVSSMRSRSTSLSA